MEAEDPISIFADMNLNSDDFFQILETHRKSCLREGRYDEAELTRIRILELRAHEEQTKKQQLQSRHTTERQSLEEAHQMEIKILNEQWETEIIPSFEEQSKSSVIEVKERHKRELDELRDRHQREAEKIKMHPPSDILDLKKRIENLSAAGEYSQAKKLRVQLNHLEKEWQEKTLLKLEEKWSGQFEKIVEKQEKELNNLRERLRKQRELKKQQWESDIERLKKRYINVKRELINQHKIERQKLTKEFNVKRQAMQSISSKTKNYVN